MKMKRTRRWVGAAVFLLGVGFFPAEAASPVLSGVGRSSRVCSDLAPDPNTSAPKGGSGGVMPEARNGSCGAGNGCCFGVPEASCDDHQYI